MAHRDRVVAALRALEPDVDRVALFRAVESEHRFSREPGEPSGPEQYLAEVGRVTKEFEDIIATFIERPIDFDAMQAPDWENLPVDPRHADWMRIYAGFTLNSVQYLVSVLSRNLYLDAEDCRVRFRPIQGEASRIERLVEARAAYGIIAASNMRPVVGLSWHPANMIAATLRPSDRFERPSRADVVAMMNAGRVISLNFDRAAYARPAGEPSATQRPIISLNNVAPILNMTHAILHTDARYLLSIVDERARITAEPDSSDRRRKFVAFFDRKRTERSRGEHRDTEKADAAWATIPILEHGTLSSRTWGIEVESVTASGISTPEYWERKYDGSLRPYADGDGECDCYCGDCEEDYHSYCSDCPGEGEGEEDLTAEFVSPVLHSFHSRGLAELCHEHEGKGTNSTPGIHVHVGADDLTGAQVVHLSRIYMAIEPLLDPIIRRRERGYCSTVEPGRVVNFADRMRTRGLLDARTDDNFAQDGISAAYGERYTALNITALAAHGTIEFRAMGPYYDYAHLIRWAWFCRELVNVAKLGVPLDRFVNAKDLKAVIDLLIEYGSEQVGPTPDGDMAEIAAHLQEEVDAEA